MAGHPRTRLAAHDITGVILAGGRGRRLGGADKGLVRLRGRPLVEHVIDRLRPQVGRLVISANRNLEAYATYGFPVAADVLGGYRGPLAGMLGALRAATTPYVLSVPCDAPVLPADLAECLASVLLATRADACVASCGRRMQPVFALMRRTLAERLEGYLRRGGREVGAWMRQQRAAIADFPDCVRAFANVNTAGDLRRLERENSADGGLPMSAQGGQNAPGRGRGKDDDRKRGK